MASSSSISATSTVLNLPELLSPILLNLPFEDILRARQVSQHFKNVIDTDPELLWDTWRSPTPPTSARKHLASQIPAEDAPYTNEISYFEPFRPFFERTLINIDEWTTEPNPASPPLRILQKQFIRKSLADFIAKNAENLGGFYITRPPLKKIESSIRVITATSGRRSSLQSTLDKGFTITNESGITVDGYLKALLDCLETSWGHITFVQPPPPKYIPPGEETGDFMANLRRKHRLEATLFTMKKEFYDEDDEADEYYEIDENGERRRKHRLTSREEWEKGAMSSTLIIKVHYTVLPEPVKKEGLLTGLWKRVFG
ncbi:hypothetical protein AOL_s00080g116 [Orbilia oligospora ATCC 24927]|uniref:F-box domain-containing protein n=2 Tax=Orbilia oligospora TaxID=2813651 RepID=G1XE81_ARTOA|nr:hypothetical protein AOL_s00080g116 [Orbilia oligospora ATCC 24927]EGX48487.1 hypothetical protein AOL_s00080g116 [Orbilia oligospora ATCC 24927]KAF3285207.1 hypothetical protein TWF970_010288 [Orbilia oligospora]